MLSSSQVYCTFDCLHGDCSSVRRADAELVRHFNHIFIFFVREIQFV